MAEQKSGTELLISTLEKFSEGEPLAVLVVWTDVDGNLWMDKNCLNSQGIGLAAYAYENIIDTIVRS
jgi:hypothetical protein